MTDVRKARQLFELGVLSLGIPVEGTDPVDNKAQATKAFTRASEWDPTMADAWLGRAAAGLDLVSSTAATQSAKPWFAIGGIDAGRVGEVTALGARRIVVVRAITAAADPAAAATDLAGML